MPMLPARVLANSRVNASVNFRQHGYEGQKVNLMVRENGHPLAKQEITLKPEADQSETIMFNAGTTAGAHSFPDRDRSGGRRAECTE